MEVYEGGKSYYYHADGLGSVVALTKSTGTAANTYFGYNTFGGMPAPSETVANPFRFTGRDYDSETGLYYYRARYYDSLFGRFLSEDPVKFEGGVDFYIYGGNAPVLWTDPFGLKVYRCCRDVDINWFMNGLARAIRAKHCFIRTDLKEAGMGPVGGGPLPSCPSGIPKGIPTAIVSHAGQAAKSDCQEIQSEDEACVNSELQIGKPTGEWSSTNNCNTVTEAILRKCHKGNCPIPRPPIYVPPIAVP